MGKETKVFFEVSEHEEEKSTFVFRAVLEYLIEQVAYTFNLASSQSLNHFSQVINPNIVYVWPLEKLYSSLINSKTLLIEVICLEKFSEV